MSLDLGVLADENLKAMDEDGLELQPQAPNSFFDATGIVTWIAAVLFICQTGRLLWLIAKLSHR